MAKANKKQRAVAPPDPPPTAWISPPGKVRGGVHDGDTSPLGRLRSTLKLSDRVSVQRVAEAALARIEDLERELAEGPPQERFTATSVSPAAQL